MNKSRFNVIIGIFLVLSLTLVFSGCLQQEEAADNNFVLYLSDRRADIDDFQSLNVSFDETRIFKANDSFEVFDLNNTEADLTELVGDNASEILNTSLDPGNYTKIELYVSETEGIVDGTEVEVMVPSEKLQILSNFTVERNETTKFVFDITVIEKGATGEYNLIPVINESGVDEEVNIEQP